MVADRTIFLTGFPGFIAARLVKQLARSDTRFLLLAQPAFAERARAEAARIATEVGISRDSLRILEGDITQDDLGLAPEAAARARAETTDVFHLAAVYDLGVRRDIAWQVNVEGTRRVNRFVAALPNLRRYHYVSTCYVAGCRTGLIREIELAHNAGFRNYYEETKYLAELEVEQLKAHLPVTIHRPAVVCGDSKTGETAKYDGIYYLINYLRMHAPLLSLINIGNHQVRLNLVPVDFVVASMAALADDERAIGRTLHLADPAPLTSHHLFETIAHALGGRASRLTVPPPLVRATLTTTLSQKITKMPAPAVPYFFLDQTYDTAIARSLLEPHAVRCPPFPAYVNALVRFVAQHPTL